MPTAPTAAREWKRTVMEMYEELTAKLRDHNACIGIKTLDEAADAIEELSHEIDIDNAAMTAMDAAMPRWIPVTERLPEHEYGESTSVLTVDLYGVMRVTYFDGGNWCWPSGEALTTMRVAPITHWMPLPEPPEEE